MLKTVKISILAIMVIAASSLPLFAESDWNRAVGYFLEEQPKPQSMETSTRTFDPDGNLKKTETLYFTMSYYGSGRPDIELIKAVENGRDITQKKRSDLEKKSRKAAENQDPAANIEADLSMNPFAPSIQSRVNAENSGRREYKNGKSCSVWNFRISTAGERDVSGTAWLNTVTGEAVAYSFEPESKDKSVENLKFEMNYELIGDQRWTLTRIITTGTVTKLFISRRFEKTTDFGDFLE